jgi:hypothetical protein
MHNEHAPVFRSGCVSDRAVRSAQLRAQQAARQRPGSQPGRQHHAPHHDPAVRAKAASDWCAWEEAMLPTSAHNPRYDDPVFRYGFARLVTHYWSNGHFLSYDGVLLNEAGRLAGVPGVVIQGNLDLINLLGTPWHLTAAWPGSELILIYDAGHGGNAALFSAIVGATDRYAHSSGNARG